MKQLATSLIVLISMTLSAQQMEVLRGSKIQLTGTTYDFFESEEVFKEVPIAYQKYLKAKKAKKASKSWGIASVTSLGLGLILWATPDEEGYCGGVLCLTAAQGIGILSTFLVFPLTGTIAIISSSTSNARFRKAAAFYNSNHNLGYRDNSSMDMSIGLTQNGVGFVLNF